MGEVPVGRIGLPIGVEAHAFADRAVPTNGAPLILRKIFAGTDKNVAATLRVTPHAVGTRNYSPA